MRNEQICQSVHVRNRVSSEGKVGVLRASEGEVEERGSHSLDDTETESLLCSPNVLDWQACSTSRFLRSDRVRMGNYSFYACCTVPFI